MKKIIATMMAFLMVLSVVSAQEEVSSQAGLNLKPSSPLWGLELAMERVQYMFQFGNKAKAKFAIAQAKERAHEAEAELARDNTNAAERAINQYQMRLKEAQNKHQQYVDHSNEEDKEEEAQQIEANFQSSVDALESVITRIKEDDNPNNDNALNGLENALQRVQNQHQKMEQNREQVRSQEAVQNQPENTGKPTNIQGNSNGQGG